MRCNRSPTHEISKLKFPIEMTGFRVSEIHQTTVNVAAPLNCNQHSSRIVCVVAAVNFILIFGS